MKENKRIEFYINRVYKQRDHLAEGIKNTLVEVSEATPFQAVDAITWNFENMVINVEGSEEDKVACALALQDVLDRTPAGGGAER